MEWKQTQEERSPQLDARKLIFIDETWAKTNMTRLYGRAAVGDRLTDKTPHGHWKTTTLIAALGLEGVRCSTLVDGTIDADVFESFVAQVLVPELRRGDVVVLDNLSSHKSRLAQARIESTGARLAFLPPYSPDLNPIERVWKLTRRLCLHNRYFGFLDSVIEAVEYQFGQWTDSNETLRRLCAIT